DRRCGKLIVPPRGVAGTWRSLVAHLTGGQGVAGSNPVVPTARWAVLRDGEGRPFVCLPAETSRLGRLKSIRCRSCCSVHCGRSGGVLERIWSGVPQALTESAKSGVPQLTCDLVHDRG